MSCTTALIITLNHYESPIPHVNHCDGGRAAGRAGRLRRQRNERAERHQPDRHRLRTAAHRHRGAAQKAGARGLEPRAQGVRAERRWHRIVTYFEDTGGNPAVALSDARSLVQQKHIQLMEGPLLASEDAAVAPYLGAQRIPLDNLALCSSAQLTSDARYGNALSSGWLCDQPDVIAADYLYQDLGYRHVTMLATDYALHQGVRHPGQQHVHQPVQEDLPRLPGRLHLQGGERARHPGGRADQTYPDVEPRGTLPHRTWLQEFTADSTGVRPPDRCSAAGWLSGSAALPPCWPMSVQLCRHDG
jgi:hypothetical protein